MSTDAPTIADENQSAATAFAGGARYVATPADVDSRPSLLERLPWTMAMILVGFVTVLFNLFIINMVVSGLHSYAGLN